MAKALKDVRIYKQPYYLVVHLKRFLMNPYPQKINRMIDYPFKNLGFMEFIDRRCPDEPKVYNLIGVVIHKGSINRGHYITISSRNRKWYRFNDSKVSNIRKK